MKAGHLKTNVKLIRALPEGDDVIARAPAAILEDIESAPGSAWLPVRHDLTLSRLVLDHVGVERTNEWARQCVLDGIERPYLAPLLSGMRAVFGKRVRHALRIAVPHAFNAIYRDCGGLVRGTVTSDEVELIWRGLPEEVAQATWYFDGCAAAISAIFDVCGARGTFRSAARPEQREASLYFRWEADD